MVLVAFLNPFSWNGLYGHGTRAPAGSAAVRVSVVSINLAKPLLISMITLVILRRKQTLLFYERLLVLVAPIAQQQQDRFQALAEGCQGIFNAWGDLIISFAVDDARLLQFA